MPRPWATTRCESMLCSPRQHVADHFLHLGAVAWRPAVHAGADGEDEQNVLFLAEFFPGRGEGFKVLLRALFRRVQPDDDGVGDVGIVFAVDVDVIGVVAVGGGQLDQALFWFGFLGGAGRRLGLAGAGFERFQRLLQRRAGRRVLEDGVLALGGQAGEFGELQRHRGRLAALGRDFQLDFRAGLLAIEKREQFVLAPHLALEIIELVGPEFRDAVADFQAGNVGGAFRINVADFHAELRIVAQRQDAEVGIGDDLQFADQIELGDGVFLAATVILQGDAVALVFRAQNVLDLWQAFPLSCRPWPR